MPLVAATAAVGASTVGGPSTVVVTVRPHTPAVCQEAPTRRPPREAGRRRGRLAQVKLLFLVGSQYMVLGGNFFTFSMVLLKQGTYISLED
jgi:hypothetical protein